MDTRASGIGGHSSQEGGGRKEPSRHRDEIPNTGSDDETPARIASKVVGCLVMGARRCLSHGGAEIETAESSNGLSQLSCVALAPLEEEE